MKANRVPDSVKPYRLKSGEYNRNYGKPPDTTLIANLMGHDVEVNEDGTLTFSPSIKIWDGITSWHGYLENGIWKDENRKPIK
jgi:hypothetical protein